MRVLLNIHILQLKRFRKWDSLRAIFEINWIFSAYGFNNRDGRMQLLRISIDRVHPQLGTLYSAIHFDFADFPLSLTHAQLFPLFTLLLCYIIQPPDLWTFCS